MRCSRASECAAGHKVPASLELVLFQNLMFRYRTTIFAMDFESKTPLVIAAADLAAELGTAAGA
jgi:hypothetical protein